MVEAASMGEAAGGVRGNPPFPQKARKGWGIRHGNGVMGETQPQVLRLAALDQNDIQILRAARLKSCPFKTNELFRGM